MQENIFGQTIDTLELSQIDFEWVSSNSNIKLLKRGLKILTDDGDYYPDLKSAIEKKLESLDPNQQKKVNANIDPNIISQAKADLEAFTKDQESKSQAYSKGILELKEKAENEKNKGNEALRSNDLNEALKYYNKSLEYDPTLSASFYNRALVQIKLKAFKLAIEDCSKAIQLNPNYSKAYLRRSKAKSHLQLHFEAAEDCMKAIEIDKTLKEAEEEFENIKKRLTPTQIRQLDRDSGFRKIEIMEDDEDEDEIEVNIVNSEIEKLDENSEIIKTLIKNGKYPDALQKIGSQKSEIYKLLKALPQESHQILNTKLLNSLSNECLCYKQLGESQEVVTLAKEIKRNPYCDQAMKIKTYLRKGMALEKLGKWHKAKKTYLNVKEIDRGNLHAAHGIKRVESVLESDPDIKEKEKNIIEQIQKIKDLGSTAFKKGELNESLNFFGRAINELERKFSSSELFNITSKEGELYCQCLNNEALLKLNTEDFDGCISTCQRVLKFDPNNVKALYRIGLCFKNKGNQIEGQSFEDLSSKLELLKKSKDSLDKVLRVEADNAAVKSHLEDVVKSFVTLQLKIQQLFPNHTKANESHKEDDILQDQLISENKTKSQNLNAMKMEKLAKEALDNLVLDNFEVPANSSAFEKKVMSLKKDESSLYKYLQYVPTSLIPNLYAKHDVPTEIFVIIFKCLANHLQAKENINLCEQYLLKFSETSKFNICCMCLSKPEKKGFDIFNVRSQ